MKIIYNILFLVQELQKRVFRADIFLVTSVSVNKRERQKYTPFFHLFTNDFSLNFLSLFAYDRTEIINCLHPVITLHNL